MMPKAVTQTANKSAGTKKSGGFHLTYDIEKISKVNTAMILGAQACDRRQAASRAMAMYGGERAYPDREKDE